MSFMDYQFWVADILRLFPCWPDVPTISSFPGGGSGGGGAYLEHMIFVIELSQFEIRDEFLIGCLGEG